MKICHVHQQEHTYHRYFLRENVGKKRYISLQKGNLLKRVVMKPTPRNSKRKPKKSYIDEDDSVQDENSNTMSEMEAKSGTVEGAEEDEDGEKIEDEQQKEVHLPHHLQALQEQIARRVNWGYVGDSSLSLQEREESKKEEEQLNNSLETVKLEMPMMKSDTSEEKETAELAVRKNKVSDAAGALLEVVGKKSAASCGCFEMFLEGEERCKENCLNQPSEYRLTIYRYAIIVSFSKYR